MIMSVASPLHFFAVVALALVAIIILLPWKSSLPSVVTVWIISIAFGALLIVIILVAILIIFYPKKLTFDKEAHLSVMRENLGDNELPMYMPGTLPNVAAPPRITHEDIE